jgi:hypothetical protein
MSEEEPDWEDTERRTFSSSSDPLLNFSSQFLLSLVPPLILSSLLSLVPPLTLPSLLSPISSVWFLL